MTDDMLRALREIALFHALNLVTYDATLPPGSEGEVTRLSLDGAKVSDAGLKELMSLKNLQHLDLARTQVTDAGLKELTRLRLENLDSLNLEGTHVTAAGLKELAVLKKLRRVNFVREENVTDAYLRALGESDLLHTWPAAGAEDVHGVHSSELVTRVSFECKHLTVEGFRELAKFKNLTSLNMHMSAQLGDEAIRHLRVFQKLEFLALQGPVTDVALKELASAKSLKTLYLWNTSVKGIGFKGLATLENLRELNLSNTVISEEGWACLSQLKHLEELHLWKGDSEVTDAGLAHLARLKNLKKLSLRSRKVTDIGVKELAALKNLQELTIYDSQATEDCRSALQKALPRCEISPQWR